MQPRPNLSDIAKALGVSVAAVSNAMSSKGRISEELAATIRKKAEEMGYVPSLAGRALRTGRSGVLGLVLADIANPLFPQIAQAIEKSASDLGYGVLIGDSRGDVRAQTHAINRLIERGADGLIIVPRHGTRVTETRRPAVMIDTPSTPGNTVSADHWNGGERIGDHLVSLGHRHIAVIGAYSDSNVQNDRLGGIKAAAKGKALIETLWVDALERRHGAGCVLGLEGMTARGVTAFTALSDLIALRAVTELQHAGIAVPEAASVTGFDDHVWAAHMSPALTTMRMNMTRIAEIAVSDLVGRIDGQFRGADPPATDGTSVAMDLIIRASSAPAPTEPAKKNPSVPPPNLSHERMPS